MKNMYKIMFFSKIPENKSWVKEINIFNVLFTQSNLFTKESFKFTFPRTVYKNYGIYHTLSTLATNLVCLVVVVMYVEFLFCFNQG